MTGFSNGITDIREQFPLLPQEETILIAEELGIKRPKTQRAKDRRVYCNDNGFPSNRVNKGNEAIEVLVLSK